MDSEWKVKLKSSDNKIFEVEQAVAFKLHTIKNVIEDTRTATAIAVPNVCVEILAKVIEYCKYHVDAERSDTADDDIKIWDKEFVKDVDQSTLCNLMMAANYLNIESLLDLTCQTVADMIKGKSPQEIRDTFNIINDFTPEEEEEIRRENAWAFKRHG